MPYVLDPFPSTAYHWMIVSLLHTHLHLLHVFPSTIYISLTFTVDKQPCCRWRISCADKTTVRWQWNVRPNTFDRFSPLYFISHPVIYTIYHVILRLNESRHDILKSIEMSYHNNCIIFHNIRYLSDPYPSTAYHSLTVCVLHTYLHL